MTPRAHHRPARSATALGAARAGSARRAAGLPGALTALVRDLQVLDLPETEHDFSVDVIITVQASRAARHEARAACTGTTSTLQGSQPSRP
jgi:hypothetical protein